MSIRIILIPILVLWTYLLAAQSGLNSPVTLNMPNEKVKLVFGEITKQTGYIFSYAGVNDEARMSLKVDNLALKNVLPILEKELQVSILVKQKYLIVKTQQVIKKNDIIIDGNIYGQNSGEPISNASVYVVKEKLVATTNNQGYFMLKVPSNAKQIKVEIAKKNYIDTSFVVVVSKHQPLVIKLNKYSRSLISPVDSLTRNELPVLTSNTNEVRIAELKPPTFNDRFWEKQREKNIALNNITDTLFNGLSISLLPGISTNKLLSYQTKNNVAINIIGGHSKGTGGLELAGVYNYNSANVDGLQIAGVSNVTYGNVVGTQVGGVMNAVNGNFIGVQTAGVVNYNDSLMSGVQIAGVYQRAESLKGVQVAGLFNKAKWADGAQISGLINYADSTSVLTQVAGLYNKASDIKGLQISGFLNTADTLEGVQIGIINKAKYIKGGFMLGLINLAGNGFKKFEISYNELGTASLGLRSGWAPLHFHFFGGINVTTKDKYYLQSGFGLASSVKMNSWLRLESDINTRSTYDYQNLTSAAFNMQTQVLAGLSYYPSKRFGIKTGVTLNHFWYENATPIYDHIASTIDRSIYNSEGSTRSQKMWLGWSVGLMF